MGAFAPKFSKFDFIQRSKTARWLAVSLVLLFMVHGIACVAVSTWMETMSVSNCHFIATYFASVHVLLASGCFTVVLSLFILCLMLRRQIKGFHRGFILCFAFALVFELAAAIVATVHQDMVQASDFQREMETFSNLGQNSVGDRDACWKLIQEKYKCCGITDYTNWLNVSPQQTSTQTSQTNMTFDVGESSLLQNCACNDNGVMCHNVPKYGSIYQRTCLAVSRDKLSFIYTFIRIFATIFTVLEFIAYGWNHKIVPYAVETILMKSTQNYSIVPMQLRQHL
ncbi:hypothetical protein CHS0354_021370 [Potamilus streckersoni]|uniref:Tetraspanin n=1 Tax=Potamilus streckersoni TaxID=2493646 RepID=A0AAE0S3R7_9BIVA|nr:hypothetical protein CHS0354_021370 [Potamilus streckersoni]